MQCSKLAIPQSSQAWIFMNRQRSYHEELFLRKKASKSNLFDFSLLYPLEKGNIGLEASQGAFLYLDRLSVNQIDKANFLWRAFWYKIKKKKRFVFCGLYTASAIFLKKYTTFQNHKWPPTKMHTTPDTMFGHSFSCSFTWCDLICSKC